MDRQTIRYPDGAVELKCSVNDAVMRLAVYEDTDLEPEEFHKSVDFVLELNKKLKPYMDAESEGRLIVLPPCKIGEPLYYILDNKIYGGRLYHIQYDNYYGKVITTLNSSVGLHSSVAAKFEDFGKTVFRSREEAEAALGGNKK